MSTCCAYLLSVIWMTLYVLTAHTVWMLVWIITFNSPGQLSVRCGGTHKSMAAAIVHVCTLRNVWKGRDSVCLFDGCMDRIASCADVRLTAYAYAWSRTSRFRCHGLVRHCFVCSRTVGNGLFYPGGVLRTMKRQERESKVQSTIPNLVI